MLPMECYHWNKKCCNEIKKQFFANSRIGFIIVSIMGGGPLGLIIGAIIDWFRKPPRSVRVHLDDYSLSQVNMNNRPNPSMSISDEIVKLDKMRQNNIITEEEFVQFKRNLIGRYNQNNYRR